MRAVRAMKVNQAEVAEAIQEILMAAEDEAGDAYGGVEISGDEVETTGHMTDFFVRLGGQEFRVRVTEVYR